MHENSVRSGNKGGLGYWSSQRNQANEGLPGVWVSESDRSKHRKVRKDKA